MRVFRNEAILLGRMIRWFVEVQGLKNKLNIGFRLVFGFEVSLGKITGCFSDLLCIRDRVIGVVIPRR